MDTSISKTKPHEIDLNDHVSMSFCLIPPGEFLMGSRGYDFEEEPIHRVVVDEAFWMGQTPVTQEQFSVWTESAGIEHKNHFSGNPNHPAESLSWSDARNFCDWLSRKHAAQFPEGISCAELPTEAHWEYACRAHKQTEYHNGDGEAALKSAGWYGMDLDSGSTHAVRGREPNDFDLYDMHGNVWESCHNRWDEDVYRRRWDGIKLLGTLELAERIVDQSEDAYRVLRGGSWVSPAGLCRSACRNGVGAAYRFRGIGFRVCLVRSAYPESRASKSENAEREQ